MDRLTRARLEHKAGMRVLEDVVTLDVLKPRIERYNTIAEGLAESRAMQQEIMKLGKFTNASGFTPGRDMQRVARITPAVWSAVMEVFGDEWNAADMNGKRDLFYALLSGPLRDYDHRFRPSLTP